MKDLYILLTLGFLGIISLVIGSGFWWKNHKAFGWFLIILGIIFIVATVLAAEFSNFLIQ